MFRKTFTGSLLAASLTAGALMTMSSATATPTLVDQANVSQLGLLPQHADVAMAENGNAVATWIRSVDGEDRVFAAYSTGGSWSVPKAVSDAGREVSSPSVAINDQGEAAVLWLQTDNLDNERIAVNRYAGQGVFAGWSLISNGNDLSATAPLSAGMDGSGTLFAARRDTNGGAMNRVRVTSYTKAGAALTQTLSDDTSFAPDIAVNNAGRAVVSWFNAGEGTSTIDVRSKAAGTNAWAPADATSIAGSYGVASAVSIGDNNYATVAYTRKDEANDYRVWASKVTPTGLVGSGSIVSPEDESASNPEVDQNDSGYTLVTWSADVNGTDLVGYATRTQGGAFKLGKVSGDLSAPTEPAAAVSDTGMIALGYADAGHQHLAYRYGEFQVLTHVDSAGGFQPGETSVDVDNQGNALLTGIVKMPDPTQGFVSGAVLDGAGATTTVSTLAANTVAAKANVAWSATDRFSALGTANLRVRSAAWNGSFGATGNVAVNTAAKSLAAAVSPGRTYCYSAQTRDANNTLGVFSAEKCTTTPVDDRSMKAAKGFKRAQGGAHYLGTYTKATKKGATLKLVGVKASRIAILVSKAPKGGKIQVSFAGKRLGTYSLKGKGNRVLIGAKSLGGLKTGNLVIKVVSKNGKVVRIDGVVAAK